MRRHRRLLPLIIAVLFLVWLANSGRQAVTSPTGTDIPNGDKALGVDLSNVFVESSYHLVPEESPVTHDLAVLAETITLDSGTEVNSNAALAGGKITVGGQINGNLTALGAIVTIGEGAEVNGDTYLTGKDVSVIGQINGDLTVAAETININPGVVNGKVTQCIISFDYKSLGTPVAPGQTGCPNAASEKPSGVNAATTLLASLGLCGLAALGVTVFPRQIGSMEQALRGEPRKMARTGFVILVLGIAISVGVIVLVAIVPPLGLVVLPFYLLAAVSFFSLGMAGWITVALVIGEGLLYRRGTTAQYPPLVTVVVGSVVMTLFLHVLALLPFGLPTDLAILGSLSAVSLGAALETRLGTRQVGGALV